MNTSDQKPDDSQWLQDLASRVLQQQPRIDWDSTSSGTPKPGIQFTMPPRELIDYLKERVIKQEKAIKTVATTICTHYNAIRYLQELGQNPMQDIETIKPNILLIGPTGVGKTYIVKQIAKKLDVPFVKADATKFSETGYVGNDVEDLVRDLVKEAEGDIERAQYGIIYLDEIDKIASDNRLIGRDISGAGVQRGLLKIIEDTEVDILSKGDVLSQIDAMREYQQTGKVTRKKISTKNILFIFSGSFDQLNEIIKNRLNHSAIGFHADVHSDRESTTALNQVTPQDLIEYGFETEFVGRVPIMVTLDHLTQPDLKAILENPQNAVINKKKIDFAAYGIHLDFSTEAFAYYAERAFKLKTGARALISVVNQSLLEYESEFANSGLTELHVDKQIAALAKEPEQQRGFIQRILQNVGIKAFEDRIYSQYQMIIHFTPDATDYVIDMARQENISPYSFCQRTFEPVEQGFQLLHEHISDEAIELEKESLVHPVEYMHRLIAQDYRH